MQKEGCDGIITSARFILHRMPAHIRTVCLEFFGQVRDAVPVDRRDQGLPRCAARGAMLAGLEHLDERYVKAVGYATKARRRGRPKMVLIGDIVGDDEDAVAAAASQVVRIANARGGEGFIAVTPEARKRFWLDRARTAAIAQAHQRVQDQRGRRDSARAARRLLRRRSSASTSSCRSRTRSELLDALEALFSGDSPLHQEAEKGSPQEVLGPRPDAGARAGA